LAKSLFLTDRLATAPRNPFGHSIFEQGDLSQFFHNEAKVAGLIYQLLGRELAHKIKISNKLLSAGNSLA
jgi:hypothetical protein